MADREYGTGEGAEPVQSGDSLFLRQPAAAGTTIIKDADVDDMKTFYKGETKVLWTGPLSIVSTPTSLNGGEAFSDWDIIEVHIALTSDTDTTKVVPLSMSNVAFNQIDAFDNTGRLRFRKLTDTTFEIAQKTVSVGNISRIIGILL